MESIIIILIVLCFVSYYEWQKNKNEKDRFQKLLELVKENIKKEEVMETPLLEEEEKDDIVDLDEADPDELIKSLKDESNKDNG